MNSKINKYKVGSSVYLVYNVNERYYMSNHKLTVYGVNNLGDEFYYSLIDSNDDIIDCQLEDNLFLDYDDCRSYVLKTNSLRGVKK